MDQGVRVKVNKRTVHKYLLYKSDQSSNKRRTAWNIQHNSARVIQFVIAEMKPYPSRSIERARAFKQTGLDLKTDFIPS